jgi:glycosyltransferase involved in cell wall biosynthesis
MTNEVLLSIITPYYNRLEYIKKLANVLEPQLDQTVEWIIVDDGTNEKELEQLKAKVIHLPTNSGGASVPRNVGLDNAKGKYITFIDSDDLVTNDYIQTIKDSFKYEYEYCYFSWKSRVNEVLISKEPPKWNCCVWNCIYKKDLIGDIRFNPKLKIAEDYEFNQKVRKGIHRAIPKIIYIYNIDTPNSLIKGG